MHEDSTHINFAELTDLVSGRTSADEGLALELHIKTCRQCARLKSRIEKVVSEMRSDRLEDVPSHILERTFDLFNHTPQIFSSPTVLEKITALLTETFSAPRQVIGVRSTAESERRFVFGAGDYEIEVGITRTGNDFAVRGEFRGDLIGGDATLVGNTEVTVEIGDLGDFDFGAVASGKYSLSVRFPNLHIEVADLTVE